MSEALCFAGGVFVGAWLWYRATRGASPIPLPAPREPKQKPPLTTVSSI